MKRSSRPARRRSAPTWLTAIIMLAVIGLGVLTNQDLLTSPVQERSAPPARQVATQTTRSQADTTASDGLPTVTRDRLPTAARRTLDLIARGGPFPYEQDGTVFQNREQLLPRQARGYYREYTVETPGENDRGARRIVAGRGGELYYTDDHYDSFRRIR